MDQTRVTSGYDVEVAMGGRYLQYLLLLALETGELPTEATFTPDGGGNPIKVELLVPEDLEPDPSSKIAKGRTYALDDGAPEPPRWSTNDPFMVEVLPAQAADVKVTLFVRLTRGAQVANVDMGLFIGITIDSEPDTDGIGLGSITLKLELLDIDGNLVNVAASQTPPVPKSELLAKLQPVINRDLSMADLGTGGRIALIHFKKLAADAQRHVEAALGLYINLILRAGPQEDNVLGPHGQLALAQNILEPGADVTFATRAGIYGDFATDAYHRMARRKGSGYHHPVMKNEEKVFDVVMIDAGPEEILGGEQRLRVSVEGEYELSYLPDPNFTVHIYVLEDVDADGIMSWASDADVEASVLADIIIGVIALATVPILGPYSLLVLFALEEAKYITQAALAEWVVEERTDKKVDAALLDVAPNRFTIVSRRWDPFFTTRHQIGLRPGATLITEQGLALWGTAALARAVDPAKSIVIREAVRDPEGKATDLIYRVQGLAGSKYLEAVAPGMHRGPSTQPDPNTDPELFQLAVDDAIARIEAKELDGSVTYEVQAVEYIGNEVANMLVLSTREINEQHNRLIGEVRATAEAAAEAQDPIIRSEVLDEFAAQGIIPTDEQVEAAVVARKQKIVAVAIANYETNFLEGDLKVAKLAAASFELSPHEFGRLQIAGLLKIAKYQLVKIKEDEDAGRYYYRDRYVREEEPTTAARLADNLPNKPRYRNTSTGRVFAGADL
ncbi:hypothetical protein [Bradyrhizobium archetypum]|uniref:Uncharacterized protein n=1 Tax=Bradyrhizobium archetypum TaxID=2721160 RepID=A0A7Y4HB07_9BRAD|nr:hypothetical protein [Bradyrhizobium archetypum]NOJ50437.1 hypothetical protein [Bradyrhizobium archetypum]